MWYVYLLRCSDNSLYCGITNDVKRRLKAHNAGKGSRYTKIRFPVELAYKESTKSKSEALKREYQIKKLSKIKKEKIIDEYQRTSKNRL